MDNRAIAKLLRTIAAAYVIKNENRFKIVAYEKAADSIEHATSEAKDLWEQGKLKSLPGIGPAIAGHLEELFKTGKVKHFDVVLRGLPQAMFPLLDIPGFGPKKAYKLVTILHMEKAKDPLVTLETAANKGEIASIDGFGVRSQEDILQRLAEYKKGKAKTTRMVLPFARELADQVIDYMRKCKSTIRVEPLGSLRRMVATIGDIDIAIATREPKTVLDWFVKYPYKDRVIERGPQTSSILVTGGKQVDLMVQPPEAFGSLLQHFTGSKNHNIHLREYALSRGISLSEHGMKFLKSNKQKKFSSEEKFYEALGLPWIPPEIREDQGEIEAAKERILPQLVDYGDIKGDLHIHTSYDLEPSHDLGASDLRQIIKRAETLGYQYVGISDHNPSTTNHTEDQIYTIMKDRKRYYEHIMNSIKSTRVHLFIMLEIDISPNGKLALPESCFEFIDAAIASVHSSFTQGKEQMTQRVLQAMLHPKVKILGHPTGRLLERREGYELDWEKLFAFCKAHDKALEINSYPDRLDLPDSLVKAAVGEGVKMVIDTDSHREDQMTLMRYGISVARRGWASKGDILNTMPYNEFREWLAKK